MAVALIVRQYYTSGATSDSDQNKLIGFLVLIIGSSIVSTVYWTLSKNGWIGYLVTVLVWFLGTLGLKLTVNEARKPRIWGVPLLPWLPSASIAINVFIMGFIDGASFLRFIVWMVLLLVFYFFVALHASYDAAKESERKLIQLTQQPTWRLAMQNSSGSWA